MGDILFYLIIGIVFVELIMNQSISYLNGKRWTSEVPEKVKDFYDKEQYAKAMDYQKANSRLGIPATIISTSGLLLMLFLDGFAWLDEMLRGYVGDDPIILGLSFFGALTVASSIIGMPFGIYSTFVIEEKFGFNKTTVKTYIIDKIKGMFLGAILGGGILALIIWFYEMTGDYFWLITWITITCITLFFTAFYAELIVPIFNKLTPLEDGSLRTSIEEYAKKVSFPLKRIMKMDGSKRSTKANAFFSGIGSRKSIVLFDTLIEDHTEDELTAVLAHEVGHYKHKHIIKSTIISTVQMAILFFILGYFLDAPALAEAFGAQQSFHIGLLGFSMLYSPISTVTGILMNMLSRKNEFEADAYAAQTSNGDALKTALIGMSIKHLANLDPHPAFVFMHYSHPPLMQRLDGIDRNIKH